MKRTLFDDVLGKPAKDEEEKEKPEEEEKEEKEPSYYVTPSKED